MHGSEVYRDLQQRASAARAEAAAVAQELQAGERRVQELVAQRVDSMRRLAQLYLPALDDQSIASAGTEVHAQLDAVRTKQSAEVARLRAEIAELARQLAGHEVAFRDVTVRLDACVARRTELEGQAAQLLQADPEFKDLATRAAETERKLARDEERAQEMAREAAAKLPAYERSLLFQYLVRRGYGTPEYKASGLFRRLDRWVAGMVDFARAKQGYDFLRVTPALVGAEVTRRREEFAPVMAKLQDKQAKVAEQVGLPAVQREGEQVGGERDRLVESISAAQRTHRARSEELATAESRDGKYYAEALGTLGSFLERTETRALELRARGTPDAADDALVAEIGSLRRDEADYGARLRVLAEQRTALEERAIGLERLVRRFREANFDAARSRFAGIDLGHALARYHDGQSSVDDVWAELRRRQQFDQPVADASVAAGGVDLGLGSRVLLTAMGHVVGAALRSAAQRSVVRGSLPGINLRIGGGGGGGSRGGGGSGGGGGFTRGAGF